MKTFFEFVFVSVVVSFLYVSLSVYGGNRDLVGDALFGVHAMGYRLAVIEGLFVGLPSVMSLFDFRILILLAVLTGVNVGLLWWRLQVLQSFGGVKFVVGGSVGLGLVASGCAACSIPFWAFLGLGGSLAFLPLGGREFSLAAILFLVAAVIILVRDLRKAPECKFPSSKRKKK